jgi:hypothetical protein
MIPSNMWFILFDLLLTTYLNIAPRHTYGAYFEKKSHVVETKFNPTWED